MRFILILIILALSFAVQANQAETPVIKVAAYHFPPYFSAYDNQHLSGDVIAALNQHQSKYRFELHDVPAQARFQALSETGCCQLMLFEAPRWGWSRKLPEVVASEVLVNGKERLVAKRAPGRGQEYFTQSGLRFGGLSGYHYPFLENTTNQTLLEQRYNVYVSMSHDINVRMLLNGRVDVIMMHDEYLNTLRDKSWYNDLLLKDEPYNEYDLRVIVNPNKDFSLQDWETALQILINKGVLQQLLRKYGLESPLLVDAQTETVR
ncbi:substrate-binding periplasmic protein [Pseudidiomarina salilacus]|uniref:substrate-binding periplasmic protein n=1 Tax=Pseudidiomarina salilacus TaxID=3384452 RepID=UPI003984E7B1